MAAIGLLDRMETLKKWQERVDNTLMNDESRPTQRFKWDAPTGAASNFEPIVREQLPRVGFKFDLGAALVDLGVDLGTPALDESNGPLEFVR